MIQYARNTQCRRSYILNYFGERTSGASSCRSCDNCRPSTGPLFAAPAVAPIDTPRGREFLLKVLSGVARAKGRFGKVAVAQMLTGSDSERMSKGRLDQLSTYGILRDCGFTRKDLTDIIDALTRIKLIETQDVDRYKPVVTLSEQGWRWLRGQDSPDLVLDLPADLIERIRRGGLVSQRPAPAKIEPAGRTEPLPAVATRPEPDSPDPGDLAGDPLWERLRSLRTDWARELKQPAYCIFTNQTLEALVRQRPMTPAALAAIKGLGRARIERHGSALLEAIAACSDSISSQRGEEMGADLPTEEMGRGLPTSPTPASSKPGAQPRPAIASASSHVTTEEWTWRLVDRGFTIAEAAAIRGLEPAALIRHLTWMVRRGHHLAIESILPLETIAAWDAWRTSCNDQTLPPGSAETIALWPLFLACRERS